MNNHLNELITRFKNDIAESGDLSVFTAFITELTEKRQSFGVVIALTLYTIYLNDLHKPEYQNIADYVTKNKNLFKANTPEYNLKLANVVDSILVDVLMNKIGGLPYQDEHGQVIEPEHLLADSFCVTKMTQFLGAWKQTFNVTPDMEIHERQEYMEKMRVARESLLQMFLQHDVKREHIKEFVDGLFAEVVEVNGKNAIKVLENERIDDETVEVRLQIVGSDAYVKLDGFLQKAFDLSLLLVE